MPQLELQRGKGTRTHPQMGDVFVVKVGGLGYVEGRVIRTALKVGTESHVFLVYLYAGTIRRPEATANYPSDRVTVPPLLVTRAMWRTGVFTSIGHARVLFPELVRHCFRDPVSGKLTDERGEPVSEPTPLLGTRELADETRLREQLATLLG